MFSLKNKILVGLLASTAFYSSFSSAATNEEALTSATISISNDEIPPYSIESPQSTLSGGAWVSSGTGPSLTSKGLLYQLNLPVVGSVPSGSTITTVNYKWNLTRIPPGLIVYLCWNTTSSCVDVSASKTGSLTNFNSLAANKKFIFAFTVPGSGSISPVAYGQNDQVIVNYN